MFLIVLFLFFLVSFGLSYKENKTTGEDLKEEVSDVVDI